MRRLAILVALVLGCVARASAQDATGDDRYRFTAGDERSLTLEATPRGVRWTWNAPAGWDTAFVAVRVAASAPDPRVEMTVGSARLVQHLDADARGLRWLNLTGLHAVLKDGVSVEIAGEDVTLDPVGATLRIFTSGIDLSKTILILAPHPDDAEIAAFGLYAGRNATIVTITSGNAGDANYAADFPDPAQQYLVKGYLRAVDSVTVPWQGGIPPERCFNLGYFDARLKTMREKPADVVPELYGPNRDVAAYRRANVGRLLSVGARTNSWAHLVDDLVDVLEKVKPAIVVAPHPYLDNHSDHCYATVALAEALAHYKKSATFLLYTNHAAHNLYPYGPAGTTVSLPPTGASLPAWAGGTELPVERLYSHPVAPELQKRKLYALETMHDLRLAPSEQASCGDASAARRPDWPRTPAVDYFRRGPRPDEIFFVYGRDGLRDLVRAFVEKDQPAAR